MPSGVLQKPLLSSKNTGNQRATRHNQPLGMNPAR